VGAPINTERVYPGEGVTAYYAIANVPQPTKDNSLTKLLLKTDGSNDPGYPPVYRLLKPVVNP
jgi:hypothetical protein